MTLPYSGCGRIMRTDWPDRLLRVSQVEHAVSLPRSRVTAPDRIFNIEWRRVLFGDTKATAKF